MSQTQKTQYGSQFALVGELLRWTPVAVVVGVMGGAASAVLLWSLNVATEVREAHRWMIWLLAPVGGCVGLLYKHFGKEVEAGNNLILDEVHEPKKTIKLRMTPFILIGTFLTHLFGGSAGREGTAIQTGASLADQLTKPLGLNAAGRRVLLMAGISAGFASVFGTPLAGAVFGLEVLAVGSLSYEAIAPCFVSAFAGDMVTHALLKSVHMGHTVYTVTEVPALSVMRLLTAMLAGAVFGLMAMFFARTTHAVASLAKTKIKRPELRPVVGGLLVSCAVFALGTTRYIGLGVPVIQESFVHQVHPWDFFVKSLFTSVTLGTGFKGGEVTPLFYIGATLGNALSHVLPLPASLLAGMGFVAVFAGAANTPIASSLMAVELFGAEAGAFAAIACVGSYLFSGRTGIYHAQRAGVGKRLPAALAAKVEETVQEK
ncbi:MAG: voltage-gated chloride channel family protein [Micavibrio sp.]|nr:voltage-gated chloride channel family protein [Micavibrio sp.]